MSKRRSLQLSVTIVIALAAVIAGAYQTPRRVNFYHVSTLGDDASDGSARKPWRTIQKAVDTAERDSVILIDGGDFEPFKASRPNLTITSAPGQLVTVSGHKGIRDVAWLAADNVTLSNITIEGCKPNVDQGSSIDHDSSGVRVARGSIGVTISHVIVRDSHGTNIEGRPIGCYGIILDSATNTIVSDNDVYHNGFGVAVVGGQNTQITNNRIRDNDVIIRNTGGDNDDDFGGVAIGFIDVTAGALAQGNSLYGNQGMSADYGTDGGAFDIYESSNITMTRNFIANNDAILETGTAPAGDCFNNVFERNVAWGYTSADRRNTGLLLRCAHGMSIAKNYLSSADSWMFQITGGGKFGGSVVDLTIRENVIRQKQNPVYDLDIAPADLSIQIKTNAYQTSGAFARDWRNEDVKTMAEWQHLTGFDTSSTQH